MSSLFRAKVIQEQRTAWLGGILISEPGRSWLLPVAAMVAGLSALALLVFGELSRRSRVDGFLVPSLGLSTVIAQVGGVVGSVVPAEGASVEAGQALIRIDLPRAVVSGEDVVPTLLAELGLRDEVVKEVADAQVAQIESQESAIASQLHLGRVELGQLENSVTSKRRQVQLGQLTMDRFRLLAEDGFLSQVQLAREEQDLLALTYELQVLERQITVLQRGLIQMKQSLDQLPAQRRELEAIARRDRSALRRERVLEQVSGQLLVKAPTSAIVSSRLVEPGQFVQPGQALLSLLPNGSTLQAQLQVPNEAIGFVQVGSRVLLRYEAFPYQKFGHHTGRVIRISRSAISPLGLGPGEAFTQPNEPYYRVLVALDSQEIVVFGKPELLRPGMRIEADILGESRKVYEWLFEPILALRGRGAE